MPERIYLFDYNEAMVTPLEGDTVYVREDAFIEKAFEFFGEHLWEYIDVKNANCGTFINIDGDKLKENFRKYIKGE